jgi:hydroxymethylbilane synthase
MSKIIRIGTRDSALALWQAKTVQSQLQHLGHETVLVPVKSTGDLVLNKPIYELGVTGVFTRTLDIALLNEEIDIAVHSLKDVPTVMPEGIVQAAVLKRGNIRDTLVFKTNEEFLAQKDAVIATGSLRRKAQWLNRYPTHSIVGIRGNVNTRLDKLENSDWNGAIFAAAGLGRLELTPEDSVNLEWMVPAPAQGAVMIASLSSNVEAMEACAPLNHEETAISTKIEREFLNKLEGGCSAPIGALAYTKEEEIHFHGIVLSTDGTKKIEAKRTAKLGEHYTLVDDCVEFILSRGGKTLIGTTAIDNGPTTIFSSKLLSRGQKDLFNNALKVESSDFIKTAANRIKPIHLKAAHKNVIITSKNGVEAILNNCPVEDLNFETIYCVGRRTKRLIEQKIGPVKHSEKNAKALANYLVDFIEGSEATYFCSDIRMDDLPTILGDSNIKVKEIEAYSTKLEAPKLEKSIEGVMFYSPSTIQSFLQKNTPDCIAYCIGESTAKEAKKYFKDVRVAKIPTVESVIDLVNQNYI